MISTPTLTHRPVQLVALIHINIPVAEIQSAIRAGIPEILAVLKAQNVTPTGAWLTHHLQRPVQMFDFEMCFPVDATVSPEKRVVPGTIAARDVARTVHQGDYSGLAGAWGEFDHWLKSNGHHAAGDMLETYTVGPNDTPDPNAWVTTLEWPLLQKAGN